MSFSCRIKAEYLKELVTSVTVLADIVRIEIKESGFQIIAVDGSHIALCDILLDKEAFSSYNTDGMTIGIDLDKVKTILGFLKLDGYVTMRYDTEANTFIIIQDEIEATLSLIDPITISSPKVPDIDHTFHTSFTSDLIIKPLKLARKIGERTNLSGDKDGLTFTTREESEIVRVHITSSQTYETLCDEQSESSYTLEYLNSLLKVIGGEKVTLLFGTEYPLYIKSTFAGGRGHIEYHLAPWAGD